MHLPRTKPRIAAILLFAAVSLAAGAARADWAYQGNQVSFTPGASREEAVAPDGSGGVYVAWSADSLTASFQTNIRLQHFDALGNALWAPGGIVVCNAPDDQILPVAVPDDSGGVIVAWQDRRNPFPDGAGIYAQRIGANGMAKWTTNGIHVATPRALMFPHHLVAASDGAHGVYLAWADERSSRDTTGTVWAERVTPGGTPMWGVGGPGGFPVGRYGSFGTPIVAAADAANGLVLAWVESYGVQSADIRAQRVTALGTPQWSGSDGLVVCNAAGMQTEPALDAWGSLGCVVAWYDLRNLSGDAYVQRLSLAGIPQWGANGMHVPLAGSSDPAVKTSGSDVYVCVSATPLELVRLDQYGAEVWSWPGQVFWGGGVAPRLLNDNAGGVALAWHLTMETGTDSDIFVSRQLPNSYPAWGYVLRLTNDDYDNAWSVVATDGAGGMYVAWHDARTGVNEVYLTRVTDYGKVPSTDVPRGGGAPFALGLARPLPARGTVSLGLTLASAQPVRATVLDPAGRVVQELLDGATLPPGAHTLTWDGRDARGVPVPAGLYFVQVRTAGQSLGRRVVIAR